MTDANRPRIAIPVPTSAEPEYNRRAWPQYADAVRAAGGEPVEDLQEAIDALAQAPCGQGYGRFVLGHLAYAAGEWGAARRYLDAFLKRTEASRPAMSVALEPEIRMCKGTLAKMTAN